MINAAALADHLRSAACQDPDGLALVHADQAWTFARLLADSRQLAGQLAPVNGVVSGSGSSLDLARQAYACSFENWPFFPVDRNTSPTRACPLPGEAALIIATSGSEGQPHRVLLGKAQLDAAAAAANHRLDLRPGDLWLNCLPLTHIGGQSILWRCARAAAGVLLHDGFAATRVADDLASRPVTHLSLVPAMLARLLEAGTTPPPTLRVALIGGAALSATLHRQASAAGWPLYVSYGMSETTALIACHAPADGPWQEGLAGRLLPGHQIRLADDGRISLCGPQIMLGYDDGSGLDDDGWLTTGDLGAIDASGRLSVLGRADDMLISGGHNLHPQAIESCLAACPGVCDIAVTGQPDPVWGDRVVALVVGPASTAELLAHARRHLPSAALPRRILSVDRLPRNAAGKLQRAALRRLVAGAQERAEAAAGLCDKLKTPGPTGADA
jgi:o-succinylbenzoate---CoA ligase